jgi:hypothetical protein
MTTRYPGAEWDPLGLQTQPRMDRHDIVCVHTMAGAFDVVDRMFHANGYGGTESHFGLAGSGRLKEWQDLDYTADANNEGNDRILSIETADKGESFPDWSGSDVPPWTDKQIDVIVPLVRWLCDHYDIPKKLIPDSRPGRRGIGYHRQGIPGNFGQPYPGLVPGGELWTVLPAGRGKPCPGDRRIRQLIEIVIPRVQGDDDDMTPAELNEALKKGDLRKTFKGLIQGSGLDALREPREGDKDVGGWRGQIKDIVREVLDEQAPPG